MFTTWLVWTLINITISMFGIPADSWIESILFIRTAQAFRAIF